MSARTFGTRTKANTGGPGKYQLDVTAADVADLVRSAGGWLYDRSKAGWDVNVVVIGGCDPRPLRILGVNTDPGHDDDEDAAPVRSVALAASADVLRADAELRANALLAMKRGIGEVLVWGDSWPEGLERGLDPVEHQLSAAARAFKGYALGALGLSESVGPTETFRGRVGVRAHYSDLTPSAATSLAQR
ncbi:hypothetical protein [Mycolicibacterium sp.]|uniref:hypothetical protein n=1 Tax=Mycolicibacterium sp. TaxID=2320850 RepID=UPI001A2AFB65|nr:hypothetical protein [Mycolicibacterium sp.]MBJ7341211.1 hypothetical protein [Mycolicibacterium sp.]